MNPAWRGRRPRLTAVRTIGVEAHVHTKILRIRDRFGFESMAQVVEMLTRRLEARS
jgi:hypothetical protein